MNTIEMGHMVRLDRETSQLNLDLDAELGLFAFGDWVCERLDSQTFAFALSTGHSLHLTGELHHHLWARQLSRTMYPSLISGLGELDAAVDGGGQELTVGDLLRGTGFRRIHIELTGRCNERCVHCYASSSPDVELALSRETILATLSEAKMLGFGAVQLTGGDPLLSPHLLEAAERARSLQLPAEIYTNGLALRSELLDQLVPSSVSFAFSVYSHEAAIHDAVTNTPHSWERTIRAISLALERGFRVRVGVVLRDENQRTLHEIRAFLTQLGVPADKISAGPERSAGRGSWNDNVSSDGDDTHNSTQKRQNGKVTVSYSGAVIPCIFDRNTVLGQLGQGDTLTAILNRRVRQFSFPDCRRSLSLLGPSLGCTECRIRHEVFRGAVIESAHE